MKGYSRSKPIAQESIPATNISLLVKWFLMTASTSESFVYRNAIEPLVAEEVEQQLQQLPLQMIKYVNPVQVIAYALNRLPALYATSEEGWHRQQLRAKTQLKNQISTAVRQGIIAVQRDPLKVSTPLKQQENLKKQGKEESKAPLRSTALDIEKHNFFFQRQEVI